MSFDCQKICAVLYREARLLDDRQWDEWLCREWRIAERIVEAQGAAI